MPFWRIINAKSWRVAFSISSRVLFSTVVAPRTPRQRMVFSWVMAAAPGKLLFGFVPIDAHVLRLPPNGDNVLPAVAVEVGRGEIFDVHPAGIDQLPPPLAAAGILRIVDAQTAAMLRVLIVSDADDEFLVFVAIQIHAPDGMAPLQLIVQHAPPPESLSGVFRPRIDYHLIAMPGLDS